MRKALGRGLDSLLQKKDAPEGGDAAESVKKIPLDSIRPNRSQPRKNFNSESIGELARSIREHGLLQPIVVSYDAVSGSYELIAGERRLRAAKLAELSHIEAIVRTPGSDKGRLAMALIENIQRDELNAVDRAVAYKRLLEEFGVSQSELAEYIGKSKASLSNTLRILDLQEEIQKAVQNEQISEGHARALLMISNPLTRSAAFKKVVANKLSVRDTEDLARSLNASVGSKKQAPAPGPEKSPDVKELERQIERWLGTKVELRTRKGGQRGKMIIHFYSASDFERIMEIIKK